MPKAKQERRKVTSKKDPNAPKRPLSAFMLYCKEHRETVKSNNPEVTFGGMGKLLGQQWGALDEEQKKKYTKLAETEKKRYKDEMETYDDHGDDGEGEE